MRAILNFVRLSMTTVSSVSLFVRFIDAAFVLRLAQRRPRLLVGFGVTKRMARRRHGLAYRVEDRPDLILYALVTFLHGLQHPGNVVPCRMLGSTSWAVNSYQSLS